MIQVQGKRILGVPKKSMKQTETGVFIPDSAKDSPTEFTAKHVGDEVEFVGVDDLFYIPDVIVKRQPQFEYNNETYIIFNEDQVIGVEVDE